MIEVTLSGHAANVLVMDDVNFQSYRNGRQFSLVHTPHAGHWNVAIDLGGAAGRVTAAVRVVHAG